MKKLIFILSIGVFVFVLAVIQGEAVSPIGEILGPQVSKSNMTGADDLWIASFGGAEKNIFSTLVQMDDGSLVVAGSISPSSGNETQLWVVRLNPDGSIIWQKSYGGEDFGSAKIIGPANDGGFFVVGQTYSFSPTRNIWVLKLTSDGNITWQETIGNEATQEHVGGATVATNGDLLMALSNGLGQPIFLRMGSDGTLLWQKTYETQYTVPGVIQEMENGDLLVGGKNWLMRLDENGSVIWRKSFEEVGNPNILEINNIQPTYDGGIVIAGNESFDDFGIWIAKLSSNGSLIWQKTYNYSSYDDIWGLQQASDYGFIVWGHGAVNNDWGESFILKLDEDGNVLWQNLYDNSPEISVHDLQFFEVKELATGDLFAVGGVEDGDGNSEAWGLKLDSNGNVPSCSIIRAHSPIVGSIELVFHDTFTTTITSTLSISNTAISHQETAVNPTYLCGGSQRANIENIFTTAGLPNAIVVSLANLTSPLLLPPQYTLDSGDTWQAIANHPYSQYLIEITQRADTQVPIRLFSAYPDNLNHHTLFRSGDWGNTWAGGFADSSNYSFAISPKNPQRMYWAFNWTESCYPCDPPLYTELHQSTDGGLNWSLEFSTIYQIIRQIAPSPVNDGDGFFAVDSYFDGNRWWVRFGSTDYLTFPIDLIALDSVDANRLYGVTSNFASGQTSPDGGQTWAPWASSLPPACVQLMAHPTLNNMLYLRCAAGLFRSADGGNSWTQITDIQGDALAPHLGNPGQILWSHDGCLYASNNNGDSWTILKCFNSFPYHIFLPLLANF